ncbi:hypothetical protein [Lysobacter gummosus]|uniref:hypothetical protein n=1 Tax=Lysobacter gummosus TaxID=262324 RepID=UPI003629CE47
MPALRARAGAVQAHGGKQRGALLAHQRPRLPVRGLGGGEILVRDFDLPHQCLQRRVLEQAPPVAAIERIGGHRAVPAFGFLVLGRHAQIRPDVIRAGGAAAQCAQGQCDGHNADAHRISYAPCARKPSSPRRDNHASFLPGRRRRSR